MKQKGQYVTIDKFELRILRTFLGGSATNARHFLGFLTPKARKKFVTKFPEILGDDIDRSEVKFPQNSKNMETKT